ncbi:MAG: hypothetical protein MJZ72_05155 [Bacteroidales bacterium]|nr:hypothetical protein [Bacteroidales bacterium]
MASFLSIYNDIEYKIKKAKIRLIEVRKENQQLKERNEKLSSENEDLKKKVDELQENIKLMTITQTIIKKEDKTETKRKITELVREIDNCIKLLNS